MTVKFCIYCGAKHLDDARFCPECGEKVFDMDAFMKEIKMPEAPQEEPIVEQEQIEEPEEIIEEIVVETPVEEPQEIIEEEPIEVAPEEEPEVIEEEIELEVAPEEEKIEEPAIEEVAPEEPVVEEVPEEDNPVEDAIEEPIHEETPVVNDSPYIYQSPVYAQEGVTQKAEEPKIEREEDVPVAYKKDIKVLNIIFLLVSFAAFGFYLGINYTFDYSFVIIVAAAGLSLANFIISLIKKAKRDNPQDKHFYGAMAFIAIVLLIAEVILPILDDVLS